MTLQKLKEILTAWHVVPGTINDLKQVQVIVTHCADILQDGTAGRGNILIAEHANRLHERFGLPIIAQREILLAKPNLPTIAIVGADPSGGIRKRPADTHEVCAAQKKICDEQGWKNVLIVTFPDHMWRACEVYKKLGLNPIPAVMFGNANIYYEKKARRPQLRNRLRYLYLWEIPARFLFHCRNWI
jgi:hypothetical protein